MNITEIAPDLHRLEIPLHKTPLKATNAYFIRGDKRDLLIDTAFNHETSEQAFVQAIDQAGLEPSRLDLFVTHLHSDHAGLSGFVAQKGARVFMSRPDGLVVAGGRESPFWESFRKFYNFTGLFAGGHVTGVDQHPGYAYAPPPSDDIIFVGDGHEFEVGRYRLRTIHTPGHTPGHFCLYEPERRLLFSGDHILGRITPNITLMSLDHDALGDYLSSLDRIALLDVAIAYPGHRQAIEDCRGRVEELKRHHAARLAEVTAIVGDRVVDTVDTARQMRWSLTYDNWDDYPPAQKLFSAGEALAHLHHLELGGKLERLDEGDGIVRFRKAE